MLSNLLRRAEELVRAEQRRNGAGKATSFYIEAPRRVWQGSADQVASDGCEVALLKRAREIVNTRFATIFLMRIPRSWKIVFSMVGVYRAVL